MNLNKFKKLYSPDPGGIALDEPLINEPVVSSLSKNYTDNVDAQKVFEPVSPLEKMFAKMAGDDIALPNPTNALEYQVKRVAENGTAGGDSAIVENAKSCGGIGWQEPGGVLYDGEITTGTTVDISYPALTFHEGDELTFKVTVDDNEEVELTNTVADYGEVLHWEADITDYMPGHAYSALAITASETGEIIHVAAFKSKGAPSITISIKVVAPGPVHKISYNMVEEVPATKLPSIVINTAGAEFDEDTYNLIQPFAFGNLDEGQSLGTAIVLNLSRGLGSFSHYLMATSILQTTDGGQIPTCTGFVAEFMDKTIINDNPVLVVYSATFVDATHSVTVTSETYRLTVNS